jgi:uncharacterized protein (UPF0303 family)
VTEPRSGNEAQRTLAELAEHERALRFPSFTNDDAWALGVALVEEARRRAAPVTVDISRNGQQLFHAALPGTAVDNDAWLVRKSRVVTRFGHSSLYVGELCRQDGRTFEDKYRLDPDQYAAHGGAFPVIVDRVGLVGVVAVSGLPQRDDHSLVVDVLRRHLAGREEPGASSRPAPTPSHRP